MIKQHTSPNSIFPEVHLTKQLSECITNRQYQDVIELLQQIENQDSVSQNFLISCLLQVTQQLCNAASQIQDDVEHNKQSLKASELRQIEFDKEIQTIIQTLATLLMFEGSSPSTAIPKSTNGHHPKTIASGGRWHSIKNFLTGKTPIDLEAVSPPIEPLQTSAYRLEVYELGAFQVYRNDDHIENWSSRKGTHILKYLLLNRERPIHKELLMEQFWPEADAEAQRNNLNVAIYGLRQNLRDTDSDFSYVLFQNDCYLLNPELEIWIDANVFKSYYQAAQTLVQRGKAEAAISEYAAAEVLYDGCFLPEDVYEDWTDGPRQELQMAYLDTVDYLSSHYLEIKDYAACASMCHKLLAIEPCSEGAHSRLMQCYHRQGQVHLALRQYDRYIKVLEAELNMEPSTEVRILCDHIRAGDVI